MSENYYYGHKTEVLTDRGFINIYNLSDSDVIWYITPDGRLERTDDFELVKSFDKLSLYCYAGGDLYCTKEASNKLSIEGAKYKVSPDLSKVMMEFDGETTVVSEELLLIYRFLFQFYTDIDPISRTVSYKSVVDTLEHKHFSSYIIQLNNFVSKQRSLQPTIRVSKGTSWTLKSNSLALSKEEMITNMLSNLGISNAFLNSMTSSGICKPLGKLLNFSFIPNCMWLNKLFLFYLFINGYNARGFDYENPKYCEGTQYRIITAEDEVASDEELIRVETSYEPVDAFGIKIQGGGDLIVVTDVRHFCRILRCPAMKK